jgi:hypothetical protein
LSSVVLKQQLGPVFEASNVDWLVDSRFGEESIDKELKLNQYFDTEWIVEGFPIEVKANTTVVGRANTWYFAYGAYRNCNSSARNAKIVAADKTALAIKVCLLAQINAKPD